MIAHKKVCSFGRFVHNQVVYTFRTGRLKSHLPAIISEQVAPLMGSYTFVLHNGVTYWINVFTLQRTQTRYSH